MQEYQILVEQLLQQADNKKYNTYIQSRLRSGFFYAMNIGIFDSGVGGLTVASAIKKAIPNIQITYFGDTAHLPYGDKSKELVCSYSDDICSFLIKQGCRTIVIACNTASALAYDYLKEKYPEIRFISVIQPLVNYCAEQQFSTLGLIATKATVKSNAYFNELRQVLPAIKLHQKATPLLVPIIEEDMNYTDISEGVLKKYLFETDVLKGEALILGCTHYPILKEEIQKLINIPVIDGSLITADFIKSQIELDTAPIDPDRFFMSDYTEVFESMARRFFGSDIHLTAIKI